MPTGSSKVLGAEMGWRVGVPERGRGRAVSTGSHCRVQEGECPLGFVQKLIWLQGRWTHGRRWTQGAWRRLWMHGHRRRFKVV